MFWRCITINTFLFDLDGTLLPLTHDEFINSYFGLIAKRFAPLGFDKDQFLQAVWAGTKAMIKNDGKATNEVVFWQVFRQLIKADYQKLEQEFLDFYEKDFDIVEKVTSPNPLAKKCITLLKQKGYKVVLATNPIFPKIATYKRLKWAGLEPSDFEYITTYENSSFCKPNLKYYQNILSIINKNPEDCIMVGNDVKEDLCVSLLNIDTYLLKNHFINVDNIDISNYKQGDFDDLYHYISNLPCLV